MIIAITMNPSIDISYSLDELRLDTVNRVVDVQKTAGGKGLNVARVMKQAGTDVISSGVLGGFIGEKIKNELALAEINEQFSMISGETRNCIAIIHEGAQTEILEAGPVVSESEGIHFLANFEKLVQQGNLVTISGSLPTGLTQDFYVKMIEIANDLDTAVILDCSGASLQSVLESQNKPLLIKPNREELSQLMQAEVTDDLTELKQVVSQPLFSGIEWIIVSLGAKGAFAKHGSKFYQVNIPKINVVNPVGSGDSMIAGLAIAIEAGATDEEILKKANTFGMLNAQESMTGKINLDDYAKIYNSITIVEL